MKGRGEEGDGKELGRLITRVMKDNNRAARIHTSLNQEYFSGSKLLHLAIFTMNLLLQCGRSSGSHRVMVSNAEETYIGNVQIVDHLHVAKHGSISTVIDVVVY